MGVIAAGKYIYNEMDEKRLMLVAAGVAFYGLLALFPAIGALMAIAGLFTDPAQVVDTLSTLDDVLPSAAADIISGQASQVAGSDSDGLGLLAGVGLLLTIYSASKGMQAIIDGLNIIYEKKDERGMVKQTLLRVGLTLGLLIGVLLCVAVAVVVPIVLGWLPLASDTEWLVSAARWPILLIIAALGIGLTYRLAPVSHTSWSAILPGAALACVLWIIGTAAFAVYVRLFGSYQETFGALGGVVILLMWLWISALIVLLGGVVAKMRASDPQK
ncbi:ribonuclease BN/unknown domain fusion protein [Rhodobacteraceae bacterium THAF1]|uniref:YihY/virulence factor BrkB family protein n=1 Tax=Palleronia sp. THAF1 TaxID=2587842 RepID=UPI000F411DAA|nr:YihY/virulence factor BrkB family protein [Palleronia sp. THAF1]QFU09100.1 ribonuclease BN/unknown domain fusion protein [Palleronia sp. THAF1]VDC24093.1 ribonuclease BN/unknown domain fusion protein [Rhodobacteraceae bacterium THAF1]